MNIVFLTHSRNHYGANRSLLDLIHGLLRFNLEVGVIAPDECRLTTLLRASGIRVATIPQARWFQSADYGSCQMRKDGQSNYKLRFERLAQECERQIVARLRQWRADVVYSNSAMIDTGARSARRLGLPHIWHLREFGDLDYGRLPIPTWEAVKKTITRSNATISVSQAVRWHFFQTSIAEKDQVVYNGVAFTRDFDRLRRLKKANTHATQSGSPFKFTLVGRMLGGKGQHAAIDALARLKSSNVRLILAGGGNSDSARRTAKKLGVAELVEFRGYISDPTRVFLEADASLMCSRNEAFGRVTAEAMAAGVPVIGRDTGGTPEIIEHHQNGILYSGESEDLAACMESLASDPLWSRELGDVAWSTARERFSIETCTNGVWNVLNLFCADAREST